MNPIEFVRCRRIVHVLAACGDPSRGFSPDQEWPSSILIEYAEIGPVWALATQPALTICGIVVKTAPGFQGVYVEAFSDDDLCQRCHRGLGEHAHLAFEHPVPPCV